MALTRRRITSAGDLKALGHPLRLELLDLLMASGPLTATQAAGLLGQTPANVSWHLRRLAEQGYVRSARPGPGRQRPWKAITESFDESAPSPASSSAPDEVLIQRDVQLLSRSLRARTGPSPQIQRHTLVLTDQEATQLAAAISATVSAHHRQASDASVGDPGRRPYAVVTWVAPVPEGSTAEE